MVADADPDKLAEPFDNLATFLSVKSSQRLSRKRTS